MGARRDRWRQITALGWPRRYPIAQVPNGPVLVALAAAGLRRAAGGTTAELAGAVTLVALVVWGWEEARSGVNLVRRILGVTALAYVVLRVAGVLEG